MAARPEYDPIRTTFARLQESLLCNLESLARAITPAAVHQTRISIRRLRTALRALKKQLFPLPRKRYSAALQHLARGLEAIREAQVRQPAVRALIEHSKFLDDERRTLLLAVAAAHRSRSRHDLRKIMNTAEWKHRMTQLQACSRALFSNSSPGDLLDIRDIFTHRHRRVLKALREVGKKPRELHRLRLRIKETRYLYEDFGLLFEMSRDIDLNRLRQLQDHLGQFRDDWGMRKWLRMQDTCQPLADCLAAILHARKKPLLRKITGLAQGYFSAIAGQQQHPRPVRAKFPYDRHFSP